MKKGGGDVKEEKENNEANSGQYVVDSCPSKRGPNATPSPCAKKGKPLCQFLSPQGY